MEKKYRKKFKLQTTNPKTLILYSRRKARKIARKFHPDLKQSEYVHHIDNNPLNNDLGNLVIMSRSDHNWIHKLMKKLTLITLCLLCSCTGFQWKAKVIWYNYTINTPCGKEQWKIIKCSPKVMQNIFESRCPHRINLRINGFADPQKKEIWGITEESIAYHIQLRERGFKAWKIEYKEDFDMLYDQEMQKFWED